MLDHLFDQVAADRLAVVNVGFAEVNSILVRRKNAGTLSAGTFSQTLLQPGHEIIHRTDLPKVERTNSLVVAALIHFAVALLTYRTRIRSPARPDPSRGRCCGGFLRTIEAQVFALVDGQADLLDAALAAVVPEQPASAVEDRERLVNGVVVPLVLGRGE